MATRLRDLRRADLVPLTALLKRCLDLDRISEDLVREKVWDDPDYSRHLATVAVDGSGELCGFILAVRRSEKRGYIKLLAVAPQARRSGVGGWLLDVAHFELARMGVTEVRLGESAPNYLWPGLDPRYTEAMLFFENRNYACIGEVYNLSVPLKGISFNPTRQLTQPNGDPVILRRAEPADKPALDGFLDLHWPPWKPELDRGWRRRPIPIHLAFLGSELLGFAAYDCNNFGTGWFGPMATTQDWQRKGIGRELLLYCLIDLKAQGLDHAVIPWVGPVGFYNRTVDARIDRVFYRYEKELK